MVVAGAGSDKNPYILTATVTELDSGVNVQQNNVTKVNLADTLDFRGSGVSVTSGGLSEAIVTISGGGGGTPGASVPPGSITMFGGLVAPAGWLICDGGSYLGSAYPDLWSVVGSRFGGDTTHFNVPDMRDVFPVGMSASKPAGARGGSASKTIAATNLPPHSHPMPHTHTFPVEWGTDCTTTASDKRVTDVGDRTGGGGNRATVTDSQPTTPNTSTTGGGVPLDVTPPYLSFAFLIKT